MFDPWVGDILWRREWLPTPVFLPEEFHGQRSMEGYTVKGHNELDTTASLVTQWLKRLPAVRETRVSSLGQEDPLEKEMATHSSILTWESHGGTSLIGYSPQGCKESDTTELLHWATNTFTVYQA